MVQVRKRIAFRCARLASERRKNDDGQQNQPARWTAALSDLDHVVAVTSTDSIR